MELFGILTPLYNIFKLYCSLKYTIGVAPAYFQKVVSVAMNVLDICMPTASTILLSLKFMLSNFDCARIVIYMATL